MKLTQILSKVVLVVLTPILACFGIASCGEGDGGDEYGAPYAEFSASGVVLTMDGESIQGIELELFDGSAGPDISSSEGLWQLDGDFSPFSVSEAWIDVRATDVDGAENGGCFAVTEQSLALTQTEPGDGNWDLGSYSISDAVIEMEEVECEDADAGPDDDIDGGTGFGSD